MSDSLDCNDSVANQMNVNNDPPSGYLLHKVVSTLLSYFNIMDTGAASYEHMDSIPPVMRDSGAAQSWKAWKAVYAPPVQNYSQKVIQATLEVAKQILLFPEYAIKDVVDELIISLSPKMIAVDWTLYLFMLEHDRGSLSIDAFETINDYNLWKKDELHIVKGLLNGGTVEQQMIEDDEINMPKITDGYSIAQLTLTRTRNLHKKVLMSGVYSVIHFQDLYTVSPIINSIDQCPTLNHKLSFLLREAGCNDGSPVIVVSIWCKKAGIKADGFLGLIKLSVQELLEYGDGVERGINLEKRSNRSNVSGKIFLTIKRISIDSKDIYADVMTCIPFCYESCLRDLLEVLYSKQISSNFNDDQAKKGDFRCRAIIDTIAIAWNVPVYLTSLLSCDILYKLYVQNKVSLMLVKKEAIDQCMPYVKSESKKIPTEVKQSMLAFFKIFYNHLKEKLCTVLSGEINDSVCKEYTEMIEILSIIHETNAVADESVDSIVKESIYKFIDNNRVISFNEKLIMQDKRNRDPEVTTCFTFDKIYTFINKCKSFLSSCANAFDDTYKNYNINIPEIVGTISAKQLDDVLQLYKHLTCEDLESTFRAYKALIELNNLFKLVNNNYEHKMINVRELFFDAVVAWLDDRDNSAEQYLYNAIKVDNFERLSNVSYFTSSLVDLFCFFSLSINFIKHLSWSNEVDVIHFNQRLYGNMFKYLRKYSDIMINMLELELKKEPMISEKNDKEKTEKILSKYDNKNALDEPVKDNSDLKIRPIICSLIANIMEIKHKMRVLLSTDKSAVGFKINGDKKVSCTQTVDIPKTMTLRSQRLIRNSFVPVKISIDKLEVSSYKNIFLSAMCIKLVYNGETILVTKPFMNSVFKTTEINVAVWVNLTEGIESEITSFDVSKVKKGISSKLEVSLNKLTYENNWNVNTDKVLSSANIEIDWSSTEETTQSVILPGYGKLSIVMTTIPFEDRMEKLPNIIDWMVDNKIEEALKVVSSSIASCYRVKLKPVSYKFKNISKEYINKMINSIDVLEKKRKSIANTITSLIPQRQIDQELVSKELIPVFLFLNENLETIVCEFPLKISVNLISKIWDDILLINESLIVPLDVECKRDKAAWSEERIKFLTITLQLLYLFFDCDGEGLSPAELYTPRYIHLTNLIKDYFLPRKTLIEKSKNIIQNFKANQHVQIAPKNNQSIVIQSQNNNAIEKQSTITNNDDAVQTSDNKIIDNSASNIRFKQYLPSYHIAQILKVHGDNDGVQNYIKELTECSENVVSDVDTNAIVPVLIKKLNSPNEISKIPLLTLKN